MTLQGYDFCLEEAPMGQNLVSPEVLAQLTGRRVTGVRLRSVHDRNFAPDGMLCFLEIECEDAPAPAATQETP